MKVILASLSLLSILTVSCGSEPAPASPTYVPGNQAYAGAPCVNDGTPGNECANRMDLCPGGGIYPAHHVCVAGRWQCLRDASNACLPVTDCTDGEIDGTCRLGMCPDGVTPVRTNRTCAGGRFICLPATPSCPTPAVDAGVSDGATSDTTPVDVSRGVPTLTIEEGGSASTRQYAGRVRAPLHHSRLSPTRDSEVRELRFRIVAISGTLSDRAGNPFLRNLHVVDSITGVDLLTPIAELLPGANAREVIARFTGSDRLTASRAQNLALIADLVALPDVSLLGTSFQISIDGGNGHYFSAMGVRRVSDGTYLTPDDIENDAIQVGEIQTLLEPTLVVSLEDTVRSLTVSQNARNVASAMFGFTANRRADVTLGQIVVTGSADVGHGASPTLFTTVVLSCSLFDNMSRIGGPVSPDAAGKLFFRSVNVPITRGTTRFLRVECHTRSTPEAPDEMRYAVTIADHTDLQSRDGSSADQGYVLQPELADQLRAPSVLITVIKHGSVTVLREAEQRRSYLGGGTGWNVVNHYRLTSNVEEVNLMRLAALIAGNGACVAEVGVIFNDGIEPVATNTLPPGRTASLDLDLPSGVLIAMTGTDLTLVARLNPTVGPGLDGCHVGDQLTIALANGITSGDWTEGYGTNYNLRLIGNQSEDLIFVTAPSTPSMSTVVVR